MFGSKGRREMIFFYIFRNLLNFRLICIVLFIFVRFGLGVFYLYGEGVKEDGLVLVYCCLIIR